MNSIVRPRRPKASWRWEVPHLPEQLGSLPLNFRKPKVQVRKPKVLNLKLKALIPG